MLARPIVKTHSVQHPVLVPWSQSFGNPMRGLCYLSVNENCKHSLVWAVVDFFPLNFVSVLLPQLPSVARVKWLASRRVQTGAAQSMSAVCVHPANSSRVQTPVQPQVGQVIDTQKCSVLSHRVCEGGGRRQLLTEWLDCEIKSHDSGGGGGGDCRSYRALPRKMPHCQETFPVRL